MKQEEITRILTNHKKWLNDEEAGVQADFRGANLIGVKLEGAILKDANFEGANLYYADLEGANLQGANLIDADLSDANLIGVNLNNANLQGANLQGVSLRCAHMQGINLEDTNLSRAIGNNKEVKSLQLGKYPVTILVGIKAHIGCREHSIEEWENFTDEEINKMDPGALEWWKEWKEMILKVAKKEIV